MSSVSVVTSWRVMARVHVASRSPRDCWHGNDGTDTRLCNGALKPHFVATFIVLGVNKY